MAITPSKADISCLSDTSKITSISHLLKMILERNGSQHHSRKYFRMCVQLNKKINSLHQSVCSYNGKFGCQNPQFGIQEFKEDTGNLSPLDLAHEISNMQTFCLETFHHLQCYLASCEFVKVIVIVIAIVSDIYKAISQKLDDLKKVFSLTLLSANGVSKAPTKIQDLPIVFDSKEGLFEDLGEEVINEVSSPSTEENNVQKCKYHKKSSCHNGCFKSDISSFGNVENYPVLECKQQTNNIIKNTKLKCPTYKIYKQKSSFLRKLSKYSSDYLKQNPPSYSTSLLLSL